MAQIDCAGKRIPLDDAGFLVDLEDWNEEVAQLLAAQEGLERLDADRIEIVKFLRDYYQKFHAFPILNYVCKNIHKPRQCVNEKFIDPIKAWKVAGLPQPSGIHFVSVDGRHFQMEECC